MVDSTRGKYIIGFTVHEAKNLSKSGSSVDPLVVVRAGGNEYKTQMKRDKVDQAKFEESFIWSDVWFTSSEFNMSFIEFELQGACIFTRNEVIGTGKVQLAMVRKRPNHTYNFKTLNLTHPTGTNSRLKVSVFCYTEGDEPPRPEEEGNDDDVAAQMEDLGAAVIGMDNTATTFQQAYHLFVHVHRAVELGGGRETFNPYVQLEFNSHTVALPVAKKSHSLSSDECFRVPVVTPLFADSILIRIWDKKEWGADNIIIQGRLSFSLLRMHAMQPKWFNFYGFDKNEVTDIQAITGMGEAAEANAYMGRLLISGRVQKVGSETELMRPGLVKGNVVDEPPTSSVTFAVDVFEIAGCPGSSVYVSVALGRQRRKTEPVERDDPDEDSSKPGRFCYKGGKGRIDTWTVVIPSEPGNQLDMLVSVWADVGRGHQRVGFKRVKVSEIKSWDTSHGVPIWIGMRPMAHLPTSIIPGSVLIGLFQSPSVIKSRPKMEVKPLSFTLRSYCIMARDLNTMKADHLPNPLVGISCRGQTAETVCMRSTTTPVWNEVLEIPVVLQCTINNMKVHPEPIQVVVYDEEDETSLSSAVNGLKAAIGLEDSKPAPKGKKGELASQGSKKTKNTNKTVDVADLAKEIGGGLFQGVSDAIGEMRGDVMAAKRRAEVVDGRRVIGRTQVQLRKIVRPDDAKGKLELSKKLKWVKLLGGRMGNHQVGDILIAFELMKTKYVKDIPKKSLSPTMKECTLSVALLGLRQVKFDEGEDNKIKPQVVVQGPSSAELPSSESLKSVTWSKKVEGPAKSLGIENDSNKRWCYSGVAGYEFLNVLHLTVNVPRLPLYEPSITFRLYDEKEDILDGDAMCEGRFSLADAMIDAKNWVVFGARSKNWKDLDKRFRMDASAKAKAAVVAKDEFRESDDEGGDNGIQVSDAEEEGEEKEYIEVRVVKGSVGVTFNGDDETSFPPIVISVTKDSEASKAGVRKGDWLVGYKGPEDPSFKLTGMWKPSQAQGWVESMDEDVVRPLGLKFRRKHRLEVTSYFTEEANQYNKGCGLEINQDPSITPPQIVDDISDRKTWKKLGVESGWYVVDVNGVDLMDLPGSDSKVQKLLKLRPCCITCRPFGKSGQGEVQRMKALADDKAFQRQKEVMLDGMASKMHSEIEHMMRHTHGELRNRGIPLPRAVIPPVTDTQHLNQHVNRSCLMDVRGIIKRMMARNSGADDDDDLARPSVTCRLEQTMQPSTFHTVKMMKGNQVKGLVKMAFKLVHPPNPEWVRKIKSKEDEDVKLFEEVLFRENYKHKQPQLLRVRSYIIRGLNVSGAGSAGYGNPYLYFNTGESFTNLQGHRQMGAVEPRFFRTEETDIYLPEQSFFEIGLMDYQGGGTDETIGCTQIDLEERWYSKEFQEFMKTNNVPVEYRPLINKSNLSKGSLEMWLEVLDCQDAAEIPVNVLYQPPPTEVEVRVIVWGVKDVSHKLCVDDVGEEREKIDIMMRCQLECRSYVGPHPKEQESDIHRSATDEGEYNWRFVYPRVQVTKGVPLDCILELSLWETFAVARPMPLCETRIDMKNYCKRVSLQRTMVQIEDDLPMTSAKHAAAVEAESEDQLALGAQGEAPDSDEEEDENPEAGIIQHKAAPPAATLKCTVQVISQVEAGMADVKAGLGRNDPNQFPALTFPKSGRSWQATLPTAAAAIEAVVDAANTGKSRCKIMMMIICIALPIFLVHYIKGSNGCPLIQASCKSSSVCEGCARCYNTLLQDSTFCFYSFLQSADSVCGSTKKDKCNIVGSSCTCTTSGSCTVAADCIRDPREFTR